MVKSGQVAQFGFSNPDRGKLGLEALDLAALRRRLTADTLAKVHRTDFHQLFLITSGTGATMVDFVDHPCSPGTLLHVGPGRVLRLPTARLDALVVLFTPAFAVLSPFGPVLYAVPQAERPVFTRAMQDLRQEYRRNLMTGEPVDLLRTLLNALLLRIARLPGDTPSQDPRFERFQQELERSFASTRNAAEYAARIGYSTRSLNRICLAATGRSAKALIDARVTLEAKRLLVHTDLSSAAIGHRLGFSEPTNFTKFFARETGMSPGAFRE